MVFFKASLAFWIFFSVLAQGSPRGIWVVGEKTLSFFSPERGFQTLKGLVAENTLIDKNTCDLWVQSSNTLFRVHPSLQIEKQIPFTETLLGSETVDGFFISVSNQAWTLRNLDGIPVKSFPALVSHPIQLQGSSSSSFWSLQYEQSQNSMELIQFDSDGRLISSNPISKGKELWSEPKLNLNSRKNLIWISYTASSAVHSYSPWVEVWNSGGQKLQTFSYPDRGVLLDACLTPKDDFLISRDIPSSPYTVPLFSFIELLAPTKAPLPLYQARQNFLIQSLQCSPDSIWTLQKSVLGSSEGSLLVELSSELEEINLFNLTDPAWKIHTCSLN